MSCTPTSSLSWIASPYLFPCTIEYSLIAAAVLYKMCNNIGLDISADMCQLDNGRNGEDAVECDKVVSRISY